MTITIEKVARRHYLIGDTYAIRAKIKSEGGHWDGERKAWWFGCAEKASEFTSNGDSRDGANAESVDKRARVVIGRARYKGREGYLVLWDGTTKAGKHATKLAFRDGSKTFWGNGDTDITKRYDEPVSIQQIDKWADEYKQSSGTSAREIPADGGPWAGARGGVRHDASRNRRAGYCERCDARLAVGEGRLEYCVEDSGCPKHHDESGYHLYCADSAACNVRAEESRAEGARAKLARAAAIDALTSTVKLAATAVDGAPAWAADLQPMAVWAAPAMVHTAAWPRLYLSDAGGLYYYVPGYFACDYDYPAKHFVGMVTAEQREQILAAIVAGRELGIIQPL